MKTCQVLMPYFRLLAHSVLTEVADDFRLLGYCGHNKNLESHNVTSKSFRRPHNHAGCSTSNCENGGTRRAPSGALLHIPERSVAVYRALPLIAATRYIRCGSTARPSTKPGSGWSDRDRCGAHRSPRT